MIAYPERMSSTRTVQDVLASAGQTLAFARMGQEDFAQGGTRRLLGLHTAVTQGRSVTFILQGLRGRADGADDWYTGVQQRLKDDPICRWFVEVRNRIEKQGTAGQHFSAVTIHHLSGTQLRAMQPPGTISTFFGDRLGRSGHVVRLADGSETTIYFELPSHMGEATVYLADAPENRPVEELLERYLTILSEVVADAVTRFG